MQTIDLDSWREFSQAIANIREKYGEHIVDDKDIKGAVRKNDILFRGQSVSDWTLKTTLERTTDRTFWIAGYLHRADSVVNEIESFTKTRWNLPSFPNMAKACADAKDSMDAHLPCYEYLAYLRHHGFPSPLLDWTSSPYVAAYFALEQSNDADRCAVFVFIECPDGKMLRGGDVIIRSFGPHITTDIRHFAQKASYTIATRWDSESEDHVFCSHHDVTPPPFGEQDVLIKITIPRSDRVTALQELEDYKINHYTLFQSEDALVRALGLRAFELAGK